jgi:lysyl-tRNA synthetase class 2
LRGFIRILDLNNRPGFKFVVYACQSGEIVFQTFWQVHGLGQTNRFLLNLRVSYHDALEEFAGIAYDDQERVTSAAKELGLKISSFATYDRLANEVWEELVEPHLMQPTFITDQPSWLTPLCRTWPDNPEKTLRFELFIGCMEIGNAYSELNDPDIQRQRFDEQLAEAESAKDDEAGIDEQMDEDFCEALDHGLPVCGGQGIGIDRLVMLLCNQQSIRDVILFPAMRSGEKGADDAGETQPGQQALKG